MASLAESQARRVLAAQRQFRHRVRLEECFKIMCTYVKPEETDHLIGNALLDFLANGTDPRGKEPLDRVRRLQRDHPEVVVEFGLGPVLIFARGKPPGSCCAWCTSYLAGWQAGDPRMPAQNSTTTKKIFMGTPCPNWTKFWTDRRDETTARFAETKAAMMTAKPIRQTTVSDHVRSYRIHDPDAQCKVCDFDARGYAPWAVHTLSRMPHEPVR